MIPEGSQFIRAYAFYGYTELNSVTFPEGVTDIHPHAFEKCENLSYVTFPASLRTIQTGAFNRCNNLQQIHYSGTIEQMQRIQAYEGNELLLESTWQLTPENTVAYIVKYVLPITLVYLGIHAAVIIVCFILEHRRRKTPFLRF